MSKLFPVNQILKFIKESKDLKLSTAQRILLIGIGFHTNKESFDAYPSIDTLALFSGLSRRATINNLKTLELKGLIKKSIRVNNIKQNTTNLYELCKEKIQSRVQEMHPRVHDVPGEGASNDKGRVHEVHPNNIKTNNKKEQGRFVDAETYCPTDSDPNWYEQNLKRFGKHFVTSTKH